MSEQMQASPETIEAEDTVGSWRLALSPRPVRVIQGMKLWTVGAIRATTDKQFLEQPSCGRKTLDEIRQATRPGALTLLRVDDALQKSELVEKAVADVEKRLTDLAQALKDLADVIPRWERRHLGKD